MEMQNVLQQVTDMLSTNGSKELFSNATSTSIKGSPFYSVMSSELSKTSASTVNMQSAKKDTANTVGVQTVNEKRQQELGSSVNQTKESRKEDVSSKDGLSTKEEKQVQEDAVDSGEMETVTQWVSSVQQQICQELSITPEELEAVLETLGLQLSDLQNIANVQQLVLSVAGEDSVTALLTNEELAGQVQDIMQVVVENTQEMAQNLDISEDEFSQLLAKVETAINMQDGEPEQVENVLTEQQSTVETETIGGKQEMPKSVEENGESTQDQVEFAQSNNGTTEMNGVSSEEQAKTEGAVMETTEQKQEDSDTVMVKQADSSQTENEAFSEETEDALDVDTKQVKATKADVSLEEESSGEMENSSDENYFLKKDGQQSTQTPVMEQVMNQVSVAKAQFVENVQDKVQITQQMQEIFEQVVEQVRVTVTADTSEMVMQLNPEHLGKVNLSVVAKEGHITAQFVTENEVARQALESQIQQLRETLGEQGLKVDKVEVSVSDFNFQEGNQANAEEQKQQQRDEHARQLHRNLNLANLDDLSDMTEAEELAVKIMQSNGNQIDYTA